MSIETAPVISRERDTLWERIYQFFDTHYPDELKRAIQDRILEHMDGETVTDSDLANTSMYMQDFLMRSRLQDERIYSPLDIYSFHQLKSGVALSEVMAMRQMYHCSYNGIFKIVSQLDPTTLQVINLVSKETIALHASGGVSFEQVERMQNMLLVQRIEPYKDLNFACGSGHLMESKLYFKLLKGFTENTLLYNKSYFSSLENRQRHYTSFQKLVDDFKRHFGASIYICHDRETYIQKMVKMIDEAENESHQMFLSVVFTPPEADSIFEIEDGVSICVNPQGVYFFMDYKAKMNQFFEYLHTANQEGCQTFIRSFDHYIKDAEVPVDVFERLEQQCPEGISKFLSDYKALYGINFPGFKAWIQFWRPDYPAGRPVVDYYAKFLNSFLCESTDIGRNDPCFCGSELKFKKCCGC